MLGRVKSAKPEEEITVTAGTETKEVLPSLGKTIKKATVNPTPSQAKTIIPSEAQQEVAPDDGSLLSKVIVTGDPNLTEENIKKGVSIFGREGTYSGPPAMFYLDDYENPTEITFTGESIPNRMFYINNLMRTIDSFRTPKKIKTIGEEAFSSVYYPMYTSPLKNVFPDVLEADDIKGGAFYYFFYNYAPAKIKIHKTIAGCPFSSCFGYFFNGSSKLWLSAQIKTISQGIVDPQNSSCALTIYCEATKKPSGWSSDWNQWNYPSSTTNTATTRWGVNEEQFDNL